MANLAQAATHTVQHVYHSIPTGVSYMTAIISSVVALLVGGGLGWWFGPKATATVTADIATAKAAVTSAIPAL